MNYADLELLFRYNDWGKRPYPGYGGKCLYRAVDRAQ